MPIWHRGRVAEAVVSGRRAGADRVDGHLFERRLGRLADFNDDDTDGRRAVIEIAHFCTPAKMVVETSPAPTNVNELAVTVLPLNLTIYDP